MGANAQTSVPTFTAGDVLTAANMNISARTGVPVFASTVTRDAAFGGTGEKTLAEGQACYVEGIGLQTYNGTSWTSWGSTNGMVFVTGATFTTATSFSLPANSFTSAYRNYRLIVNVTAVTSDADFTMRMRAAGSDNSTANYINQLQGYDQTGAASNVYNVTQTSWNAGEQDTTDVRYNLICDILNPQAAFRTNLWTWLYCINKLGNLLIVRSGAQQFDATTSFDSMSFISSVASSISGNYRLYAYGES